MHNPQHHIALCHSRNDHTNSILIINLVHAFMIDINFFVNAVDALDTAFNNRLLGKVFFFQPLADSLLNRVDELFPFVLLDLHDVFDL